MKTTKIDKNIQEKFKNRTFEPSASAWERLSNQLDKQEQEKKKGWFFYAGIAASILILVSIGIQLFSSDEKEFTPKQEIVIAPIDTVFMDSKFKNINIENEPEEAIVNTETTKEKVEKKQHIISEKEKSVGNKLKVSTTIQKKETPVIIAKVDEKAVKSSEVNIKETNKKVVSTSKIKVNVDDLLFAVTHSKTEVEAYYAKNDLDRNEVLKSIEKQLKKSNVKVDANTILAEVERGISDDTFKNNFLQTIKKKVSDIATAVASRNN